MFRLLMSIGVMLSPSVVVAEEAFAATNTYVTETAQWPISEKTGYWTLKFEGVSQVTEGPIETLPVEFHGAGFWGATGLDGNGICIHGTGEDTFILRFDVSASGNTWEILSGTGKYVGLTVSGSATTQRLPGNRRISNLVGQVSLGE